MKSSAPGRLLKGDGRPGNAWDLAAGAGGTFELWLFGRHRLILRFLEDRKASHADSISRAHERDQDGQTLHRQFAQPFPQLGQPSCLAAKDAVQCPKPTLYGD